VDPLLKGDWPAVCAALKREGFPLDLVGARAYIDTWCDRINPVYLMASTPFDFRYPAPPSPDGAEASSDDRRPKSLLVDVLLHTAKSRGLPVALKIGARRGVNPSIRSAGDGVQPATDLSTIRRLCQDYPDVRFLVTVLSRVNQHELCVLSRKFRNLHLYGCWWFCNNPSIIDEMTRMRLEMLGTAFTCQHSDCRVIDQLLYKWKHSRAVVGDVLAEYYRRLAGTGWRVTAAEVRRDVWHLFGGSYESFIANA